MRDPKVDTIPEFFVVSSLGEIYTGLLDGGCAGWSSDWSMGKPLNNIKQLQTIKKMMVAEYGELNIKVELIYL